MRLSIIYIIAIIIFAALGCNKSSTIYLEDDLNSSIVDKDTRAARVVLEKIQKKSNVEQKKLAYSSLSDSERFKLWKAKFEDAYSAEKDENRKELLFQIYDFLSPSHFVIGKTRDIFYKGFVPQWLDKSKDYFSETEIFYLLFTLERVEDLKSHLQSPTLSVAGGETVTGCHCHVGSGYTCGRVSGGGLEFGTCSRSTECTRSDKGCGALWDLSCDGDKCTW